MSSKLKYCLFVAILLPTIQPGFAQQITNPGIDKTPVLKTDVTNTYHDQFPDGTPGPELIKIKAGSFQMGDLQYLGKSYELPIHTVTLTHSFSISRYPITFEQYDKFTSATNREAVSDFDWGRGQRPVININQDDANAYASWLSRQTGHTYRLPSEAEWEYSARANTTSAYPWGDQVGNNNANCKDCIAKIFLKMTTPVGQYPANQWGLYDMMGNVWELTADCWNDDYVNAPVDGSAWRSGDCIRTVLRGGSWGDTAADLRSSTRLRSYAGTRTIVIGFRLVREE